MQSSTSITQTAQQQKTVPPPLHPFPSRASHLYRESPGSYGSNGTASEVPRVLALLKRGAHQHQPQVRSPRQQSSQHDQQKLAVAIPLVNLQGKGGGGGLTR